MTKDLRLSPVARFYKHPFSETNITHRTKLLNMKSKIGIFLMLILLSGSAYSASASEKVVTTEQAQQARVIEIRQRVDEIRAMDLSHLNAADRKSVKHELKGMNKELRQMSPILYISGGALILIIILIILLL
jgi:hypothetical protein